MLLETCAFNSGHLKQELTVTTGCTFLAEPMIIQVSGVLRGLDWEIMSETSPEDESWFWTLEWQAAEKKVDLDIKEGRYQDFDSVDDLLEYLDAERKRRRALRGE